MGIAIYKRGQGYWTRTVSGVAAAIVILMGAMWLWDHLGNVRLFGFEPMYVQGAVAILIVGFFGAMAYYLIATKPKVVDFMIATEGEMKKVNWSSRSELFAMTRAVLSLVVFVAVVIWLLDLGFAYIFQAANVLEAGG